LEEWRFIDSGPLDGATQMAIDQTVVNNTVRLNSSTLRVYQWKPYCISLGYNQSEVNIDLNRCRQEKIDVVRRPTGGRAVFHAQELTYSVVIKEGDPLFLKSISEIYKYISRGLVLGIEKLGVPARLQKRSLDIGSHYRTSLSTSCFSAATRYEVMVEGRKLVGSAQRRLPKGILQHGSILIGDEHLSLCNYIDGIDDKEKEQIQKTLEDKTISIGHYIGIEIDYSEVAEAIRMGLGEALNIKFEMGDLIEEEWDQVFKLREEFSILSNKE
jgi:lipoate-protein ligase A